MKILYFRADWCAPCRKVGPVIEQITTDFGIELEKVNTDSDVDGQKRLQEYNVMSLPTFIVVDDEGLELERVTGAKPRADLIEALGFTQVIPEGAPGDVKSPPEGVVTSHQVRIKDDKIRGTL